MNWRLFIFSEVGVDKEMMNYDNMREILNHKIPEVLQMEEYIEMTEFWKDEEIPMYCYFEILEYLFLKLLKKEVVNDELLNRILDFMEDMANSEDVDVQNLLAVQILEALFGLDFNTFDNMENKLFRSSTKALFDNTKIFFQVPIPPRKQ